MHHVSNLVMSSEFRVRRPKYFSKLYSTITPN
jgi:hypothetical protein